MVSSDDRKAGKYPLPDPRAEFVQVDNDHFVRGMSCESCGYASAVHLPWCPRCRTGMREKLFGPRGIVWSSTVVHIPLPDREPPYSLAYVDLEAGPRVLAHISPAGSRLKTGQSVRLAAASANGDLQVIAS